MDPETKCWNWLKSETVLRVYWNIKHNHRWSMAHRVAYETTKGPIPPGNVVMHTCDNPSCVNPKHLRTGTQSDNMRDALAKDRRGWTSKHPKATVIAIRKAFDGGARVCDLSRKYGISYNYMLGICHRKYLKGA